MSHRVVVATAVGALGAIAVQFPLLFAYTVLPHLLSDMSFNNFARDMALIAFWVSAVAAVAVIALGLPTFAVLYRKNLASVRNVALAGALIAGVGALIVGWPVKHEGSSYSATTRFFGVRDLNIDGAPTLWGWLEYAINTTVFSVHGLVGALVFVLVWRKQLGSRGAP